MDTKNSSVAPVATAETNTPTATSVTPTDTNKPNNEKRTYILATLAFVVVGIATALYWFFVMRFEATTNDAYVQGMQVPIVAQTAGNVTEVYFDNTDIVHAGDVVVKLDDTTAKLVFETSKNDLAIAVRKIQTLYQQNKAYKLAIEESKINLTKAKNDYDHRLGLNRTGAISIETLQHARDAYELAQADYEVALQNLRTNEAQLLSTEPFNQPEILAAANNVRDAWITLYRTEIRSPVTGYVARRNVQIGSDVNSASSLMAIVPIKPMWIDANFKETQLKDIRIGQTVKLTSDFYGSDVVYEGKVTGLDMGTGSAFSLLPAQNATGNWIKVVQRLPVRVDLDSDDILEKYPLRIGLSMNVTIDIKDKSGHVLEVTKRTAPAFQSNVLVPDLTKIDALIEEIIEENTYDKAVQPVE